MFSLYNRKPAGLENIVILKERTILAEGGIMKLYMVQKSNKKNGRLIRMKCNSNPIQRGLTRGKLYRERYMCGKIRIFIAAALTVFTILVIPWNAAALEESGPYQRPGVSFIAAAGDTPGSNKKAIKMCVKACRYKLKQAKTNCEDYRNRNNHTNTNPQSARLAFARCMGQVKKIQKRCLKQCQ